MDCTLTILLTQRWYCFNDQDEFARPFTQHDVEAMLGLLRKTCDAFLNEIRAKQLDAREPKDPFRRFQIEYASGDVER